MYYFYLWRKREMKYINAFNPWFDQLISSSSMTIRNQSSLKLLLILYCSPLPLDRESDDSSIACFAAAADAFPCLATNLGM